MKRYSAERTCESSIASQLSAAIIVLARGFAYSFCFLLNLATAKNRAQKSAAKVGCFSGNVAVAQSGGGVVFNDLKNLFGSDNLIGSGIEDNLFASGIEDNLFASGIEDNLFASGIEDNLFGSDIKNNFKGEAIICM